MTSPLTTLPSSALGCFGSDPYAYLLNLYWDQQTGAQQQRKTCSHCGETMTRVKFRRHVMTCKPASDDDDEDEQQPKHTDEAERTDEEIIIFSARTDTLDDQKPIVDEEEEASAKIVKQEEAEMKSSCSE